MASKRELMSVLQLHKGKDNGIKATLVASMLGDVTRRCVTRLVKACREDGELICGTPKTGYYLAQTHEEVAAMTSFIESRVMGGLKLLSKMKGKTMAEALGQLPLTET